MNFFYVLVVPRVTPLNSSNWYAKEYGLPASTPKWQVEISSSAGHEDGAYQGGFLKICGLSVRALNEIMICGAMTFFFQQCFAVPVRH